MNRFSFGDPNEREEPTREPEEFDSGQLVHYFIR